MAIYFLRCEPILRHKGRSMVGRSAYGAGISLYDQRKKRQYNYSDRNDVLAKFVCLPQRAPLRFKSRKVLWNEAEKKEQGQKGRVGYEIIVCVPYELRVGSAIDLLKDFALTLSEHFECAVDYAIHIPPQHSPHHDSRNMHAHILLSKRKIDALGFQDDLIELRSRSFKEQIRIVRRCWEILANNALAAEGLNVKIDRRSLAKQGIDRIPQIHVGKRAKYLHFANKIPESKKKHKNQVLITASMIKGVHATSSTKRSSRSIKKKSYYPKSLYPKR